MGSQGCGPWKFGPQWTQAQPCPRAPAMTLTSIPDKSLGKGGGGQSVVAALGITLSLLLIRGLMDFEVSLLRLRLGLA